MNKCILAMGLILAIGLLGGCGEASEAADGAEEKEGFYTREAIAEYYMEGKWLCAREDCPELYENSEKLMKQRFELLNELLSAGNSYMDRKHSIAVPDGDGREQEYFLLEGIEGWAYFEERAKEIYNDSYVEEVITPLYMGGNYPLFAQQENRLYRKDADGWIQPVKDSFQIWQEGENRYYITGIIEYDAQDSLFIGYMRGNDDKVFSLELLNECIIEMTKEQRDYEAAPFS